MWMMPADSISRVRHSFVASGPTKLLASGKTDRMFSISCAMSGAASSGEAVPAGTYVARLRIDGRERSQKLVVIR